MLRALVDVHGAAFVQQRRSLFRLRFVARIDDDDRAAAAHRLVIGGRVLTVFVFAEEPCEEPAMLVRFRFRSRARFRGAFLLLDVDVVLGEAELRQPLDCAFRLGPVVECSDDCLHGLLLVPMG